MHYFSIWYTTLHVSDRFIVHHQESSTVYTAIGICHTGYADRLPARSGWNYFCTMLLSLRIKQPTRCINIQNLLCHKTLHVSGIFCAHHQELSTVRTEVGTFNAGYVTTS